MSEQAGSRKSLEEIGMEVLRVELTDLVARANFADERFAVTRNGKRVAGLVGLEDLKRLLALDAA